MGVAGAGGSTDKEERPKQSAIAAQLAMFEQMSKHHNVYMRNADEEGDDFIEEQEKSTGSESGLEESDEEQKSEGISTRSGETQSDETQSDETQSDETQSDETQSEDEMMAENKMSEGSMSDREMDVAVADDEMNESEAQEMEQLSEGYESDEEFDQTGNVDVMAGTNTMESREGDEAEMAIGEHELVDRMQNAQMMVGIGVGTDSVERKEMDEGEMAAVEQDSQDEIDIGVGMKTIKSKERDDTEDEQDGQAKLAQEETDVQVMAEVKIGVGMESKQLDKALVEQEIQTDPIQLEQDIHLKAGIDIGVGTDNVQELDEAERVVDEQEIPTKLVKEKDDFQTVVGIDVGVGTDTGADKEIGKTRVAVAEQDTQTEQQDVQAEVENAVSVGLSDFVVTKEDYLENQPLPPPVLDQDIKGEEEDVAAPGKDEGELGKVSQVETSTINIMLPPDRKVAGSPSTRRAEERLEVETKHVPEEASVEVGASSSQTSVELGHSEAFLMVSEYQREKDRSGEMENLNNLGKEGVKTGSDLQPKDSESEVPIERRSKEGENSRTHVRVSARALESTDPLDQFRRKGQKLDPFRRKGKKQYYQVSAGDPEDYETTMGLKRDMPRAESPSWADIDLRHIQHELLKEEEESPADSDKDDRQEVKEWKRLQSKKYSINSRITVFEKMSQEGSPDVSPSASPHSSPTRRQRYQSQENPQVIVTVSEEQSVHEQPPPAREEVQIKKAEVMQSAIIQKVSPSTASVVSPASKSYQETQSIPLATEAANEQQRSTDWEELDVKKVGVSQSEVPLPSASSSPLAVSEVKPEMIGTPKAQRAGRQYHLESTEEIEEGDFIVFQSEEELSDEVLSDGEDVTDGKPLSSVKPEMVEETYEMKMPASLEESTLTSFGGMQPVEANQWQLVYGITPFSEMPSERDETLEEDQSVEQTRDEIREQAKEEATRLQAISNTPGSGEQEQDVHPVLSILSESNAENESIKEHSDEFVHSGDRLDQEKQSEPVVAMDTEVVDTEMPELAESKQEESVEPATKKKSRAFRQPSAPAPLPPQAASSPPEAAAAAVQAMPLDGAKVCSNIFICVLNYGTGRAHIKIPFSLACFSGLW